MTNEHILGFVLIVFGLAMLLRPNGLLTRLLARLIP